MADKSLHLTVITPAKAVLDTDAKAVVVPAFDGEVGVLPGHAAMLALLGTGELRVTKSDDKVQRLVVRGGFLQVLENKVTVLTPESATPEELKPEALKGEALKLDAERPVKLDERELLDGKRAWLRARQKIAK